MAVAPSFQDLQRVRGLQFAANVDGQLSAGAFWQRVGARVEVGLRQLHHLARRRILPRHLQRPAATQGQHGQQGKQAAPKCPMSTRISPIWHQFVPI